MEKITDWAKLWRELVETKNQDKWNSIEAPGDSDIWLTRAREYDERVKTRWENPDSTREAVLSMLHPDFSLVDIGAGTGAWTMLFAHQVRSVTAVEPSQAMRAVLQENLRAEGIENVRILPQRWEEAECSSHSICFCSHAMYGVADFPAFIRKMDQCATWGCFLLIRVPSPEDLLCEASQYIRGQPYDSPNFVLAYNILLQMGIRPDVRMETGGRGFSITSASEEEALGEAKRRLGLSHTSEHDSYLRNLLRQRLIKEGDHYRWPGTTRSALISWPAGGEILVLGKMN